MVVTFLAALGPGSAFSGDDSNARNASPASTVTVPLDYQETSYSIAIDNAGTTAQSAPFKKEPAAGTDKISRGVLHFGADGSNDVAFVWQHHAGKLYLDLNHNQDLTDDPAGVFTALNERTVYYQTFTNLHLSLNTASGKHPVLADITLYDYRPRPSCTLAVRSFWQGKATLQGQDWQVGVIPGSGDSDAIEKGHMLLRPWEKRNQAFNAGDGSLDAFPFARKLFVGGHAYQVQYLAGSQNGEIRPELFFAEQSVTLGELKITGKYIRRLTLPGGSCLVVLDQPANTVKIPVGTYNQPRVVIEQGGAEANSTISRWPSPRQISVNDRTPTVLNAGGPLTNSVTATRRGRNLNLSYQLVGAGGAAYQLATQDRSQPPEFAIYRGDKKVASGKFAYG
jgi:hypothetical protein